MARITLTDDFDNQEEITFEALQEQSMDYERRLADFVADRFLACECGKVVLMSKAAILEDEQVACPDCSK